MPRRNKRKTANSEPHKHAPTPFDRGYRPKCKGCAFYGDGNACLTSDGKCLKVPPPKTREEGDAKINRGTDTASTKR
jgi:hypothetical protein